MLRVVYDPRMGADVVEGLTDVLRGHLQTWIGADLNLPAIEIHEWSTRSEEFVPKRVFSVEDIRLAKGHQLSDSVAPTFNLRLSPEPAVIVVFVGGPVAAEETRSQLESALASGSRLFLVDVNGDFNLDWAKNLSSVVVRQASGKQTGHRELKTTFSDLSRWLLDSLDLANRDNTPHETAKPWTVNPAPVLGNRPAVVAPTKSDVQAESGIDSPGSSTTEESKPIRPSASLRRDEFPAASSGTREVESRFSGPAPEIKALATETTGIVAPSSAESDMVSGMPDETRGSRWRIARIVEVVPRFLRRGGPEIANVDGDPATHGETLAKPGHPVIEIVGEEPHRRAANGNIIIDADSSLNRKPWYSEDWMKIPDSGPGRDIEIEYGGVRGLRLMAGSVRGTRHQYYGQPNEDAFSVAQSEHHLIVVVADGVGAANFAAYGSSFMSNAVAQRMRVLLREVPDVNPDEMRNLMTKALQFASDSVQQWTESSLHAPPLPCSEVDRHDLSATVTVCTVPIDGDSSGLRRIVCGYVGDSPCYTLGSEGWTLRSKVTKDGEIMDLATTALPNAIGVSVAPEFCEFEISPDDALLLMTDGIGTSLGSGKTPVGRWLASRLRNPTLPADFLTVVQAGDWFDTMSFDRQGEDDDRTLIMVYDHGGASSRRSNEEKQSATTAATPGVSDSPAQIVPEND